MESQEGLDPEVGSRADLISLERSGVPRATEVLGQEFLDQISPKGHRFMFPLPPTVGSRQKRKKEERDLPATGIGSQIGYVTNFPQLSPPLVRNYIREGELKVSKKIQGSKRKSQRRKEFIVKKF
ncbi:hypothetical protein M9H77_06799 [Catharanthus roseus]|uniref:Uncharacterized protein n=1 Tax=Catharanthus roseus TaxID=4058 RepID=A0ACC0BTB0_CATRO|nr:hypothetical protein M9H77_06799 [Catharanthus roseus]